MENGFSFSEFLKYVDEETSHWKEFFHANPKALDVSVSIAGTKSVRDMLLHIFAVELRYAERLNDIAEVTPYERHTGKSAEELFAMGEQARQMLAEYLAKASDLDRVLTFPTLTSGTLSASKKKIAIHMLLHGVRHWAQLATALREAGFTTGKHDFIFSNVMP
jgi:uncharacterized damage-inducible protein DinB